MSRRDLDIEGLGWNPGNQDSPMSISEQGWQLANSQGTRILFLGWLTSNFKWVRNPWRLTQKIPPDLTSSGWGWHRSSSLQ